MQKRYWSVATNILVGLNLVIYAVIVFSGGFSLFPDTKLLLRWGANFGPYVVNGQYWRLMTSSFLHIDVSHLFFNMLALWWLGRFVERVLGAFIFVAVCFLTGVGSAVAGLIYHPQRVSAGASGIAFGLAGVAITFLFYSDRKSFKNKLLYRRVITLAIFGLVYGVLFSADSAAHLGGIITGLMLGFSLARPRRQKPLLAVTTLYQAKIAVEQNDYDSAIRYLKIYLAVRPQDQHGHALLGFSLDIVGEIDEAAHHYRRALELKPQDLVAEVNLAGAYVCQKRADDAIALIENGYSFPPS